MALLWKICEVRGEVCWDGHEFVAGAIEVYDLKSEDYFIVMKTRGAALPERCQFFPTPRSLIITTHDSVTISEVRTEFSRTPVTVHLQRADPTKLKLSIDKLPARIKVYRLTVREEENLRRQLRDTEQQLKWKDEQQQNLQRQLREMEKQLGHCQVQLRENEKQETKLLGQLREKEQQLTILHADKKKESVELKEISDLQRELRNREQDNVDLQKLLSAATEKVSKYESQLRTRDWILNRDEIQPTNNFLGDGSFGRVVEGRYCGSPVAIKRLHRSILTPQERSLFEREMDIASRCRHPCLLQFIGATVDESPLFVTELMEKSLRALLGTQQLSKTEVSVISLDVARALNYLHQRKPEPIVHRDVSSANVLLWKQNDQWRGKLSDYGTVRFLQEIMTKAPGNMSYSAPEVGSPYNQTVKIDVYSFGVLFCEMCSGKLPVIENRVEQVKLVTNREFQGLIMWCIEEDPEDRPSMEEIIEKLEPAV